MKKRNTLYGWLKNIVNALAVTLEFETAKKTSRGQAEVRVTEESNVHVFHLDL